MSLAELAVNLTAAYGRHDPSPSPGFLGRRRRASRPRCATAVCQRPNHAEYRRASAAGRSRHRIFRCAVPELGSAGHPTRSCRRNQDGEDHRLRQLSRRRRHEQGDEDGKGDGSGLHGTARRRRGRYGSEGDRPTRADVNSALRRSCRRRRRRPRSDLR